VIAIYGTAGSQTKAQTCYFLVTWGRGRMEDWKDGRLGNAGRTAVGPDLRAGQTKLSSRKAALRGPALFRPDQSFLGSYWPGGLRSLAAVEAALGLVSSADTLFDQRDLWYTPGYDGA
jgi:hypothetical protein